MTFHKWFTIASLNWISLSNGFVFGQVACLVSSLQRREDGIQFTDGQISLIASSLTMMCFIGFVSAAVASDKLGRRWPYTLFSIMIVINWIVLYYARDMYQFMLSRILGGISVGALLILNVFVTSEYTSADTRAFYLNMVTTVTPGIGTTIAHAIGITMYWRNVVLFGIFPAALGIFLPFLWEESPHWLASKGRFKECEISFRKLHGQSQKSERELKLLIQMETTKLEKSPKSRPVKFLTMLKTKYFWEIFVLSVFMHAYLAASEKLVFNVLASVILEEITGASNVFLYTMFVDAFLVLGACLSCYFIRKTSFRTLLFTTGFTGNGILVLFSIFYYFRNGEAYFNWINVVLLALYFIIVNTGPYPLLEALYSEMFPLEFKVYIFSLSSTILVLALSLSIFLLPSIVSIVGYHGLFILNSGIMTVSLACLWLRLPETKGKTLQEIELYLKTKSFDIDNIFRDEQVKSFL